MDEIEITIYRHGTLFCRFRKPDAVEDQAEYKRLIKDRFQAEDGFMVLVELVSEVRTVWP